MATGRVTRITVVNGAPVLGRITRIWGSVVTSIVVTLEDADDLEPGLPITIDAIVSGGTFDSVVWSNNYSGFIDFTGDATSLTYIPPATLNGTTIQWTYTGTKAGLSDVVARIDHTVLAWAGGWQYNASGVLVPSLQ